MLLLSHWFSKCGPRASGGPQNIYKEKSWLSLAFNKILLHLLVLIRLYIILKGWTSVSWSDLTWPHSQRSTVQCFFSPLGWWQRFRPNFFLCQPSVKFWVPKLALSCQNFENPCSKCNITKHCICMCVCIYVSVDRYLLYINNVHITLCVCVYIYIHIYIYISAVS